MFDDLLRMRALDLASDATAVLVDSPISKIIGTMRDRGLYEVFVEGGGKVGMVTARSLLSARDIVNRKTSSVLTVVPKIAPNTSIEEVTKRMTELRVRTLPLVVRRTVIKEVRASSIVDAMASRGLKTIRAQDMMTPNPIVVAKEDMTTKARSLMIQKRIDHLPVLEDRHLVGIITSQRIVTQILPAQSLRKGLLVGELQRRLAYPVERLMEKDPLSCEIADDGAKIFEEMKRLKRTYSLVKLWDDVQGIITLRDFVKLLLEKTERSEVPMYIVGLPDDAFEAEAAKMKFARLVATTRRSLTKVEEARSVIKTKDVGGQKRRYEVTVALKTPSRTLSYREDGWDLPTTYDRIVEKVKRAIERRRPRRKTGTLRVQDML